MKNQFKTPVVTKIRSTDPWGGKRDIYPNSMNGSLIQARLGRPSVTDDGMLWMEVQHPSDVPKAQKQALEAEILLLRRYGVMRDPDAQTFVDGLSFGRSLLYIHRDDDRNDHIRRIQKRLEEME